MAAAQREAVNALMGDIFKQEPGVTSVEALMELVRRTADGCNLRVKRQEAVDFMRGQGRHQV